YAQGPTIYAIDPISETTTSLTLKGDELSLAGFAAGDFKGDGLQEIVIASHLGIRIVSAVDATNFSKGIQSGPFLTIDPEGSYKATVAVGDFDGDGRPEVAVAYDRLSTAQGWLSVYTVDPKTLALQFKHTQPLTEVLGFADTFSASAAAGRFGTTLHDQLIVGYRISRFNSPDPQDARLKS